jgi:hypothetical protein
LNADPSPVASRDSDDARSDTFTESLFTMRRLEDFVPADYPLRPIRAMVNEALVKMHGLFAGL